MTILFISDLHLDEKRPDVIQAFLGFIEKEASQADALYILGDFFEAWVGDDYENTLIATIKSALKTLSDSGVSLYIMHGNRDFLIGEQFCQQTGATLLTDPCCVELYGQQVLLMHGDSLCTDDHEYMAFRAQVRNPMMQQQLLQKPIAERIAIAQQLRQASGSANSNKADDIMDVNAAEVSKAMLENKVSLMIHGHTHRPQIHQETLADSEATSAATRIVLGDWDEFGWQLRFDETGYDLSRFAISACR